MENIQGWLVFGGLIMAVGFALTMWGVYTRKQYKKGQQKFTEDFGDKLNNNTDKEQIRSQKMMTGRPIPKSRRRRSSADDDEDDLEDGIVMNHIISDESYPLESRGGENYSPPMSSTASDSSTSYSDSGSSSGDSSSSSDGD